MSVREARSIADQATGLDELAPVIHGGQPVTRRKLDDGVTAADEQRVGLHKERSGPALDEACEGRRELGLALRVREMHGEAEAAGCRLDRIRIRGGIGISRIDQEPDIGRGGRQKIAQQLEPLRQQRVEQEAHSGDVAAGPIETFD